MYIQDGRSGNNINQVYTVAHLAVNYVKLSVRVFSFLLTGSNFVCLQIENHVLDVSLFYFFEYM